MRRALHIGSASASTIRAREEIAASGGEAYRSMAAACTFAALHGALPGGLPSSLAAGVGVRLGRAPSGVRCGESPVGSRDKWLYFSYTRFSLSVVDPKQTLGAP
jgi:hypothetical protein